MVSVSHKFASPGCHDDVPLEDWLATVTEGFSDVDADTIRRACRFVEPRYAGRKVVTGVPLLQHALGTAAILAGMRMDPETIAAAILHAVFDDAGASFEEVETQFGANIRSLVEGMTRMDQIAEFSEMHVHGQRDSDKKDDQAQIEGLRKMLLAMVEDIRVVLIKLAERTQTMRCLSQATPDQQEVIARETIGLFAPLANRLGVWQIKWELEDLSRRYLEPELYKRVAKLLDERRVDREKYIERVIAQLKSELKQAGIGNAEVTGRPKHIHSIINKMKKKGLEFSEVYDVRAVRVLVDDVKDCYTTLGIVHNLWQPIPGEFDDYISHPKSNDYRSLHTAVIGPEGKAVEVQIRTHEMHHHAELGVAAHWRYKEGSGSDARYDEKIAWLRQILEWKDDVSDSGGLVEQFKNELFQDQVYVLTPQGKVIDLPKGATPVDFAYTVHTDLGHRCRGARVDGNMVPLNYKLQNGQRVEILAAKQGAPSRDWLNPVLGYLQSHRARAKVRHWFKYQNFEENVSQGRAQLDRELHRLGIGSSFNQERFAQKFDFSKLEDFLAAVGRGDITIRQIVVALQEEIAPPPVEPEETIRARPARARAELSGVLVEGVGNLLTTMAKCCKPVPPDPIVGYVTRGRGVTIHRKDCPSMLRLREDRRDRLVAAQWGGRKDSAFAVDVEVDAYDRQGLLRDVSEVFVREKVNVTKVSTLSRDNQARMQFTIEIADLEQLSRVLALLTHVQNVSSARRLG
jgi:GTP pyrophosphokinase